MKRLTIPGSGTESRATKPARVSAPATLSGAAFGASREDTGAPDLLEAAQAAEIEQQATLEATPVEQSYPETLALYVQAKHDQVEHIEDRLENLIDRQQARLQQTQASAPGPTKVIEGMEEGEVPPELGQLDAAARRAVLAELKAIMAVYDAPCDLPAPPEGQSPRA